MKVLFVSSANVKKFGLSPIVVNQMRSLLEIGVEVEHYGVKGKGILGYFNNIRPLRQAIRNNGIDLIHAHYALTGILATFVKGKTPIIVSIMGSEIYSGKYMKLMIRIFMKYSWNLTIIKSARNIKDFQRLKYEILPNGIDLNLFKPMDKESCRTLVGFDKNASNAVFIADPKRIEKNVALAIQAMEIVKERGYYVRLEIVHGEDGVPHEMVPVYINAADVLLLTSKHEGSPNIVKEAMACCTPIVATDVGDVRNIIGDTSGCFISGNDPEEIADNIVKAIRYGRKTNGRKKVEHLDKRIVAHKLQVIYAKILSESGNRYK